MTLVALAAVGDAREHAWGSWQHLRGCRVLLPPPVLTCPKGSRWLLVSLSFWKETSCLIQWAPVAGESGCTYSRPGMAGSAFPVTDLRGNRNTELRAVETLPCAPAPHPSIAGGTLPWAPAPHPSIPRLGSLPGPAARPRRQRDAGGHAALGEKKAFTNTSGELIALVGAFPVGDGSRCFPCLTPNFPPLPNSRHPSQEQRMDRGQILKDFPARRYSLP